MLLILDSSDALTSPSPRVSRQTQVVEMVKLVVQARVSLLLTLSCGYTMCYNNYMYSIYVCSSSMFFYVHIYIINIVSSYHPKSQATGNGTTFVLVDA